MVNSFVQASQARHPETAEHVERIGLYSALLYKKMGYSQQECEVLRQASMLHDLGKMVIPDSILKKSSALTSDERRAMQRHAFAGYQLLSKYNTPECRLGGIIALTHHEKWDGSGYPQGLRGTQIPLEGRIVAIADVFDALITKRCYKSAWNESSVMQYMKENSGTHFDPDVFAIFENNSEQFLSIAQNMQEFMPPIHGPILTSTRTGKWSE